MKILKLPIDTIIKCECGCEFEVEYEDFIITSNYYHDGNVTVRTTIKVHCPICNKRHILKEFVINNLDDDTRTDKRNIKNELF